MPYSTSSEVQAACGGPQRFIELADHDDDGVADTTVVDNAIADADSLIDSYCQKRHAVPFAAPTRSVKRCSADLAKFLLKKQRGALTQEDRDDQEAWMAWLSDISKGIATPGTDPVPEKSTSVRPKILPRSEDEDVSRDALKGWW